MIKTLFLSITLWITFSSCQLFAGSIEQKIDSLNEAAYNLRNSNTKPFMSSLIDSAITLSIQNNYKKGEGVALLNYGVQFYKSHKNDSALVYLQKAHVILEKENDLNSLGLCVGFIGLTYRNFHNYKKAKKLFQQEAELFIQSENYPKLSRSYRNQAINYVLQGKNAEGLEFFFNALDVDLKYDLNPSREYGNIGVLYNRMGKVDAALVYYNKENKLYLMNADTLGLIKSYSSLASVFNKKQLFDSGMVYLNKSLKFARLSENISGKMTALVNIAMIYSKLQNYDSAKLYVKHAMELEKENPNYKEYGNLIELSDIYYFENQFDSSIMIAQEALIWSQKSKDRFVERISSQQISRAFERLQRYDSALLYYKIAKAANDTIFNTNQANRFSNLQIQIETLEQDIEIETLTNQKIYNRNINYALGVFIILIIITAYFALKGIKEKNRRKQLQLEIDKKILEQKIEHNKTELFNYTINMINKNNSLSVVEEVIKNSESEDGMKTQKLLNAISKGKSSDKDWDNFNKYFGAVHHGFYDNLKSKFPSLTSYELRLCSLMKLHLSNKEMAEILFIEPKSVKMSSYRLKKKLQLDESQKLSDYIVLQS